MKPLIIKSLLGEEIPRAPVWLMRQAGRYLKEYNAIKEKYTFLEMCKNPEIAFEVSMQPMRFFGPDAAIVFADILLPAESIGIEIDFAPGPKIKNPIDSSFSTKSLKFKDIQLSQKHVFETISLLKKELSQGEEPKAVIGFAGAPWTMACYLVNQKNFKNFSGTSIFAKQNKKVFHEFMEVLTNLTIEYVLAQIESGADMIQLFDTWAINLDQNDYS